MQLSNVSQAKGLKNFAFPETPLFCVEETSTHYLLTVDLPNLPATDVRIRQENKNLVVDGVTQVEDCHKMTFFQFHAETKSCRSIYYKGKLWLMMPKQVTNLVSPKPLLEVVS